jgi:alpha-galactosidase
MASTIAYGTIAAALALLATPTEAHLNGVALTPAMGWNTWNKFGTNISEDLILGAAQALKKHKLDEYGYQYVIIDDAWQAPQRAADNSPVADPVKFPNGIKHIADKVHELGLKIGIYSDAGKYTCGGHFGSLGYEEIDAKTYAEWGIDYLKYDNCFNEGQSGTPQISAGRYRVMSDALNATGRPILYSMCSWGDDAVWNWASTIANSWRMSGDIYDNFDREDDRCPCKNSVEYCPLAGYHCSVMNIVEKSAGLGQKARPGAWNDMDMLEVGNGGMTHTEYVSHFSLWALFKSPLILGNDVEDMTEDTLSIITNKHIIALNQDLGFGAGVRVWKKEGKNGGSTSLWKANLKEGYALLVLNATPDDTSMTATLADFFIDEGKRESQKAWKAYDLWQDGEHTHTDKF